MNRHTFSFAYFLKYVLFFSNSWLITWMKNVNEECLAFAWFFATFSLALLIKVLLIKNPCIFR